MAQMAAPPLADADTAPSASDVGAQLALSRLFFDPALSGTDAIWRRGIVA